MLLTSTSGSGSCGKINGTVIAEACATGNCTCGTTPCADVAAATAVVTCAVLAAVAAGVAVAVVRKRRLQKLQTPGAASASNAAGWTVTEESGLLDRGSGPSDHDDAAEADVAAAGAAAADAADTAAPAAAAAAMRAHERQIVGAMSKLLADDASRSRWTTVQELALLLPQFRTHRVSMGSGAAGAAAAGTAGAAAAGDGEGRDNIGAHSASADAAAAAAALVAASSASLVVVEAASALLRTALAEQKLLLLQAVDRTELAQMVFYGERVQLLQSVAGEGVDGGGFGSRAHADDFPMECVAPGLLLRKVCLRNAPVVIR